MGTTKTRNVKATAAKKAVRPKGALGSARTPARPTLPDVSIVIPIYNEEAILHAAVMELIDGLREVAWTYDIVLAENGSRDSTWTIALDLSRRFDNVYCVQVGEPNYGAALRKGIESAQGRYVFCDEIDLCDVAFHKQAFAMLENDHIDFVVGSKVMPGAQDERPWLRRTGTAVINGLLRISLGFTGSDTHGLKAFKREAVLPVVARCIVDRDLFASELVIRAEREGLRIREIPVRVLEKRPPSSHLFQRVPNVLKNLARLVVAIRFNEKV